MVIAHIKTLVLLSLPLTQGPFARHVLLLKPHIGVSWTPQPRISTILITDRHIWYGCVGLQLLSSNHYNFGIHKILSNTILILKYVE